jgi:hypothetical protein
MKKMLMLIGIMAVSECWAAVVPGKGHNPKAVAQVAAGELAVANASWWGFDDEDATWAIQAAIDSKAKTVIVPYMGQPWLVRPIFLRSNLELIFEPGVLVLAKKGEFRERWDCLLTAIDKSDITIRGYGAILKMRKRDYRNPPYPEKEEWKHGLKLEGSRRILVEGLRIESSGGDGIYIGSSGTGLHRGSEDIVIRDCVSHDNHRQGISVTDVENLLVENCVFSGTEGTGPSAGIDYEPDKPVQKLVNCVFRNCLFEDNAGHGMFVRAHDSITPDSPPISIRFENCISRMTKTGTGGDSGMCVRVPGDEGPPGTIEFINCLSENSGQAGANVYGHSVGHLKIRFVGCSWVNSQGTAVVLNMQKPSDTGTGSIEFVNCSVYEEKTRPTVQVMTLEGDDYGDDIVGTITVHDKLGARIATEPRGVNVNLSVVDSRTATAVDISGPAAVAGKTMPALDRRAADIAGYDDEATFGELWETYDLILDLPRVWQFRLDFKDEGQQQDWGGVTVDKTQYQPIKIGEWWEPQGHQYNGIAWYRVDFEVPVTAKGNKLALSFGAVDESAWVYLNGVQIGSHDRGEWGWEERFEIGLGDAVKIGETNTLAVRVRDRTNYGGIWKSVKLIGEKGAD